MSVGKVYILKRLSTDPKPKPSPLGPRKDELSTLKLSVLKSRARAVGISDEQLDEVDDAENTKEALIQLIREAENNSTNDEEALRAELSGLKLSALKGRAREMGISDQQLDEADDSDNVKEAVVSLVIAHQLNAARGPPGSPVILAQPIVLPGTPMP